MRMYDDCGICGEGLQSESDRRAGICDGCFEKHKNIRDNCFMCGEDVRLNDLTICSACGEGYCRTCPESCSCTVDETLSRWDQAIEPRYGAVSQSMQEAKVILATRPIVCGLLVGLGSILTHVVLRCVFHLPHGFIVEPLTAAVAVCGIMRAQKVVLSKRTFREAYPAFAGYIAGAPVQEGHLVHGRF